MIREIENVHGQVITLLTNNVPAGQYTILVTQDSQTVLTKKILLVN